MTLCLLLIDNCVCICMYIYYYISWGVFPKKQLFHIKRGALTFRKSISTLATNKATQVSNCMTNDIPPSLDRKLICRVTV